MNNVYEASSHVNNYVYSGKLFIILILKNVKCVSCLNSPHRYNLVPVTRIEKFSCGTVGGTDKGFHRRPKGREVRIEER